MKLVSSLLPSGACGQKGGAFIWLWSQKIKREEREKDKHQERNITLPLRAEGDDQKAAASQRDHCWYTKAEFLNANNSTQDKACSLWRSRWNWKTEKPSGRLFRGAHLNCWCGKCGTGLATEGKLCLENPFVLSRALTGARKVSWPLSQAKHCDTKSIASSC